MRKNIVLLDMDAVLIHAMGYRASAKATIETIARQIAQPHIEGPEDADMLHFEAQGIIFDWDTIAICTAAILAQAEQHWGGSFKETLNNIATSGVKLERPNYAEWAHRCPSPDGRETSGAKLTLGTLFPQIPLFEELLGDTHSINSPVTQIFQHYVLGDEQYARSYGKQPHFETQSMLEILDEPLLTDESRQRLMDDPNILPVIYTARPSLPPAFVQGWQGYAPEAEIAQRLLNMFDVPLTAYGRMQWLAREYNAPSHNYAKPSPIHGLAAIYSAVLYGTPNWEEKALRMAVSDDQPPAEMFSEPWHVVVCEDSPSSIRGVRTAVTRLAEWHDVTMTAVGIAHAPENEAVLTGVAEHVVGDVNTGLSLALGW